MERDDVRTGDGESGGGARIERRPFGRTGHDSSRVIFGAAALGSMGQEAADRTLAVLDDFGVNHIDTAAGYGDSELRIAPWLASRRDDFFLATKTNHRTGDAARAGLERSLERLGTDHVDLIQLHNLVEDDEWDVATGPDGALDALVAARDEGLCRFIGVTGHGLRIARQHRRSVGHYPFDSVLLPYSHVLVQDSGYRAEVDALVEECTARGIAVQTIKSVARRRWRDEGPGHFSWYEPMTDAAAVERAVRWVLADDRVFLNSSSDTRLLRPILEAAIGAGAAPEDELLAADRDAQEMEPLFDGIGLERI